MVESQASNEVAAMRHVAKKAVSQQYLTLDIRTREGCAYGLPYSYLISIELDRSQDSSPTLRLLFTSHQVTVKGRNLIALYDRLLGHRLAQIVEDDSSFDDEEQAVYVESVVLTPVT